MMNESKNCYLTTKIHLNSYSIILKRLKSSLILTYIWKSFSFCLTSLWELRQIAITISVWKLHIQQKLFLDKNVVLSVKVKYVPNLIVPDFFAMKVRIDLSHCSLAVIGLTLCYSPAISCRELQILSKAAQVS